MLRLLLLPAVVLLLAGPVQAQEPPEGAYADFVPNANGETFMTWGETPPDPGLVTRIFALSFAETCSWAIGGDPEQRRPEVFDLRFRYSWETPDTPEQPLKLYRFFCNAGAYNEQHVYMVWDGDTGLRPISFSEPTYAVQLVDKDNPDSAVASMQLTGFTALPTLVNSSFDPATGEMSARSCFRGICDASSQGTWVLDGPSFRLQQFLVDPSYDGEVNLIELVNLARPVEIDVTAVVGEQASASN